MIAGTDAFGVGEPVFSQFECLFPLEEVETIVPGLFDEFREFARGKGADLALGMDAYPEQHFVLDDVADAGEDVLVEECIGGQFFRFRLELFPGFRRVPRIVHYIGGPVVLCVDRVFEHLQRAGVEIQIAGFELQMKPGSWLCLFVDAIGAEEQEVDADRLFREEYEEVFAPASEFDDLAAGHAGEVDGRVTGGGQDLFTGELFYFFFQYDDGGTFWHIVRDANGAPGFPS